MQLIIISVLLFFAVEASAFSINRERIHVVGSSIVYPFVTRIAEEFGRNNIFSSPYVESSSTGAGFNLFCNNIGEYIANVLVASRPIRASEAGACANLGEIIELKIGHDALVIANSKKGANFNLSKYHIFQAVAAQVVKDGEIVPNFYQNWYSVDPVLPDKKIEIYGPASGSGTYDILLNLVFVSTCMRLKEFQLNYLDFAEREIECKKLRHDGVFVEISENDGVVIRKLIANSNALGVVSFGFWQQNLRDVKANAFGGIMPDKKNIMSGVYNLSRPLYVYVKKAELESVIGLTDFVREIVSEDAISPEGYLSDMGFIALSKNEREKLQAMFVKK